MIVTKRDKGFGVSLKGTIFLSAVSKGFSAILDQGFYSGGNFLITILLARWLSPSGYGAFALSFAALWFLIVIQQSVISVPLLVFAKGKFSNELHAYVRCVKAMNRMLALLVVLVLGIVTSCMVFTGEESLAWAFGGLAFATIPMYEALLCRRMAFALGRPEVAAGGNAVYFVLVSGGIVGVFFTGYLSAFFAFIVLGIAACSVVLVTRAKLRVTVSGDDLRSTTWQRFFFAHVNYGCWALGDGLCAWVHVNLVLILLAGSVSLDAAGGYRAVFNLAQPAIQVNAALGLLIIPLLVRKIKDGRRIASLMFRMGCGPVALAIAYGVVLIFLGKPLLHLLYGGRYLDLAGVLFPVAAIPLVTALNSALGAALRAVERPSFVFVAQAAGAIVVAVGWLLLPSYNIYSALGLTLAGLIIVAVFLVGMVFLTRDWRSSHQVGWCRHGLQSTDNATALPGVRGTTIKRRKEVGLVMLVINKLVRLFAAVRNTNRRIRR